jgi:hypothetical protein
LDLVGDSDVGVQIRIARAAISMGERGRDEAADVDLRTPCEPSRAYKASFSTNRRASPTAAWWARSIAAAIWGSATAHNADTDLTGEKVRSYPATGCAGRRESFAIAADNSRSSIGTRPCSA